MTTCKHCGEPIERCVPCGDPFMGWRHTGYPGKPVGAHYCGGRSINSVAEPTGQERSRRDKDRP